MSRLHLDRARIGTAMLSMITAWAALWSWRPLVEFGARFLGVAFVAGLVLVVGGSLARMLRVPRYVVPLVQVVLVALFLNLRYASAYSWHGLVPTGTSVRYLVDTCRLGAGAINTYVAPVTSDHAQIYPYLAICSTGILLAMDILVCTVRKVPLAALPLLLTLSIPISILESSLNIIVFVITSLLFLMLLAGEEVRRVLGWGRSVVSRGDLDVSAATRVGPSVSGRDSARPLRIVDSLGESFASAATGASVRGAAFRVGALATLGALVVPLVLPMAGGWFDGHKGSGGKPGPNGGVTVVNPLLNLRRDLVKNDHSPMLYAKTSDPSPTYVRLTVLDQFTGDEWKPSPRNLPDSNRAKGQLPSAPGMLADTPGRSYPWKLRVDDGFATSWLPTPYPTRRVDVEGDWRYDTRTLDIVNTGGRSDSRGLSYKLTGFEPKYDAVRMNDAISPPGSIEGPMTNLPSNLPTVIDRTARRVANPDNGQVTAYQEAVRLQDWFRANGGFTYSTKRAPGSGMGLLADFITKDKVGYCEQFAAAMAVMARSLDIPARVVVGFQRPGDKDGDEYVYTSDDLHAWPELYFSGQGWVRFEPTPAARTGDAPAYTSVDLPTGPSASDTPTAKPSVRRSTLDADTKQAEGSSASESGSTPWLPIGAGIVLLLLVAAAPRAVRDARRRSRLSVDQPPPALAHGVWEELRATARDLGLAWNTDRSVRQTMAVLLGDLQASRTVRAQGDTVVEVVERARYAPAFDLEAEERAELVAAAGQVTAAMRQASNRSRSRVAAVLPLSVFSRRRTPSAKEPTQVDETV